MRIASSFLNDFKNIKNAKFNWGSGINFISGPNGSGKTNLLESLNILSGWGTFKSRARDCVNWNSETQRAYIGIDAADSATQIFNKITAQISSKITLKLDGKITNSTDLRLVLPSIVFQPSDINLIDGSPAMRRIFIDKLCALYFPPYARRLAEFKQIARHRAALLRKNKPASITDVPFANLGGWIMDARRSAANQLLEYFQKNFNSKNILFFMTPELNLNKISGVDFLFKEIGDKNNIARERAAMRIFSGPSHDDLKILINNKPASDALSRGQKRRFIIFLIIAAGHLTAYKLRKAPILLFDDLAAELDRDNLKICGDELFKTGWQIFITGTEDPFPKLEKSLYSVIF